MFKQSLIFMLLCGSLAGEVVLAGEDQKSSQEGKRRGPPSEAFAACADKKEGDQSSFKGRRGHDVQGTCMTKHGKLVLVPEHHMKGNKGNRGDKGQKPAQE